MSAEMASSINTVEVYVPLLNEGTNVLRPTAGLIVEADVVEILPTDAYDPAVEEWEFPPGSKVKCAIEMRGGRSVLVACQRIPTN